MIAEPQAHALIASWVETVKNVCEILAILVGAAWAYLNYFRGRIYKPRLECAVDALIEKHSGHPFLRATVRVKNLGLSKVQIEQKGTALLIYSANLQEQAASFPIQVRWSNPVGAFDVFSGGSRVESSEAVAESIMVALPHGGDLAYKVALTIVSGDVWWTADAILGDTKGGG
jgi:hypothetical protein